MTSCLLNFKRLTVRLCFPSFTLMRAPNRQSFPCRYERVTPIKVLDADRPLAMATAHARWFGGFVRQPFIEIFKRREVWRHDRCSLTKHLGFLAIFISMLAAPYGKPHAGRCVV